MLPCSVTASDGMPSRAASFISSSTRQAPSSSEYSVCRWRWTKSFTRALLPLDGAWWFAADVVDDAVDAAHLVDDAAGRLLEQCHRQGRPIGGHEVGGLHRAQRHHVLVRPVIAHHADAANRQED